VRSLVASISGVPVSRVYWDGEPEHAVGPISGAARKINLSILARSANGTLEPRYAYDGGTSTLNETHGTHRQVTVTIKPEIIAATDDVGDLLEDLRVGLELPTNRATLRAADLAFVGATLINEAGVLDVELSQVISKSPTVPAGTGWIEKVTTTDGDPAPTEVVDLTFTRVP
jgi:hypothetical protein